jgi:hypothetical protein
MLPFRLQLSLSHSFLTFCQPHHTGSVSDKWLMASLLLGVGADGRDLSWSFFGSDGLGPGGMLMALFWLRFMRALFADMARMEEQMRSVVLVLSWMPCSVFHSLPLSLSSYIALAELAAS